MKNTKTRRLPLPTQLLTKGQWWSRWTTHLLHLEQWIEASDLSTRHVLQMRKSMPTRVRVK